MINMAFGWLCRWLVQVSANDLDDLYEQGYRPPLPGGCAASLGWLRIAQIDVEGDNVCPGTKEF